MLRELIAELFKREQEQQGIRLVSCSYGLQRSKLLPNGFMLETQEIWVDHELLETRIEIDGTEYLAMINDVRTILPVNGYPSVDPYNKHSWPSNHFGMGIFCYSGYVAQNKKKRFS